MSVTIEAIFLHEYFLCLYGVALWYILVLALEKRAKMQKKQPLVFKEWLNKNSLDVLATIFVAPMVVVFDDEIIGLYNDFAEKDIQVGKLVYLCAGPVFNFLLRLITAMFQTKKI